MRSTLEAAGSALLLTALCVRLPVLAVLFLSFFAKPGEARPAFFWTTAEGSFLSFENLEMNVSEFRSGAGESGGKRVSTQGQYDFGHPQGWVLGAGHEYSDLDISDPVAPPQSNAHLHTLHLATQWTTSLREGELRLAAAPAVSVSSNALKSPEVIGRDSLQLWGAALYTRRAGSLDWVLGVAHDNRFGAGRAYPVAGVEWRGDRLAVRAVYPDFRVTWGTPSGWGLRLALTPDGNEWQAFDRDLTDSGLFQREGWQGEAGLRYRFASGVEIGGVAGWHGQQQWRYRRLDGTHARVDGDDRAYFGIRLAWYPR